MKRDTALRLDGAIMNARAGLDALAAQMKRELTDEEYQRHVAFVGEAMGALFAVASGLYEEHPDIVPPELTPD